MEVKKIEKLRFERQSSFHFAIGLALVLGLTYLALEWKTFEPNGSWDTAILDNYDELSEEAPLTIQKLPLPPPPKIQTPPIIEIIEDDETIIETIIEPDDSSPNNQVVTADDIAVIEDPIDVSIPMGMVEEKPIFPGCEDASDRYACFQEKMFKHIRKTFDYPKIAQEMGIQGKVYMTFVIQKDGSIDRIQVMRSPDDILGKEATRIISKLPRMIPGKHHGAPVKVPFSIPINFVLQ